MYVSQSNIQQQQFSRSLLRCILGSLVTISYPCHGDRVDALWLQQSLWSDCAHDAEAVVLHGVCCHCCCGADDGDCDGAAAAAAAADDGDGVHSVCFYRVCSLKTR